MKAAISCLLILIGLAATASARAGLVGDTVGCSASSASTPPIACAKASEVVVPVSVSAAPEFTISENGAAAQHLLTGNLEDDRIFLQALIEITWFSGDRLSFTSLDFFGDPNKFISGVSINTQSGILGFEAADLSFTDDSISIDLSNQDWERGAAATLLLSFGTRDIRTVPEPYGLTLLALGLLALGLVHYTRR